MSSSIILFSLIAKAFFNRLYFVYEDVLFYSFMVMCYFSNEKPMKITWTQRIDLFVVQRGLHCIVCHISIPNIHLYGYLYFKSCCLNVVKWTVHFIFLYLLFTLFVDFISLADYSNKSSFTGKSCLSRFSKFENFSNCWSSCLYKSLQFIWK